jgi:flagellar hook-associated protein 3 FlgL
MRMNPNYTPDILNALWQTEAQQQTATEQLATGLRVNVPSDDPTAAAEDVENLSLQSNNDQYQKSTTDLEGMLQTADSSLSSVVTSLNQAISLGVQGANGGLSAADLQSIGSQVQGIQSQVLQLANTSYQGSYLFSGTATTTAPFSADASSPSGVQYNGNAGVNSVSIAEDQNLQVNLPGSQVFQGAGGVFASLQQLTTALQSGNTASIGTATTQVSAALASLSQQRVFYGNAVNQLNANQTSLQTENVDLRSQETALVGANMAEAATNLSQATTAQSATLAALAKIIPQSLLNYLQ